MFHFLLSLFFVLSVSYLAGSISRKFGQPKVVGEMLGGIVIGPSCLGLFFPDLLEWIFTQNVNNLLDHIGQFGLALYMLLIGMHVSEGPMTKAAFRSAFNLALAGLVPTFIIIYMLSWYTYPLLQNPFSSQIVYSLFMAASISVTAFPVLVRVLEQFGELDSELGKLVILGASLDDAFAWILLPIVLSISTFSFSILSTVTAIYMLLYLLIMFFVVKPLMQVGLRKCKPKDYLSIIILVFLLSCLITDKIGLHCIFGGFIAGVILPKEEKVQRVMQKNLNEVVHTFLVPIYFIGAGLKINLQSFSQDYSFLTIFLFLLLSFLSKYACCGIYAKKLGLSWSESSAVGALMNARGLMILVFAQIGLSNNIISSADYSILFIIALVTTTLMTPLFKWSLAFQTKKSFSKPVLFKNN